MGKYSAEIKKIIEKSLVTNILPRDTSLSRLNPNPNGITKIDNYMTYRFKLPTETEKQTTTGKYGFEYNGNSDIFWPHFVKHYNLSSVSEVLDRILVSSTLEGGTSPLETYAVSLNSASPIIGSSVIDLNSLMTEDGNPVFTKRFDEILRAAGYTAAFPDIHSFVDVQNFIENEKINEMLTPRAIIQVVLESYFIPNAIGETDPNSRNILLCDTGLGKFDVVFRIDAESNTYLRDVYNERSGYGAVPKGIYSANENIETEFLQNIKTKTCIGQPKIDWQLFAGFMELSDYFLRSSYIDNAIFQGYRKNQGRYQNPQSDFFNKSYTSPYNQRLSIEAYNDFSTKTQERIKKFTDRVYSALGYVGAEKYPFDLELGAQKPPKLRPILLDKNQNTIDERGNFVEIPEREL